MVRERFAGVHELKRSSTRIRVLCVWLCGVLFFSQALNTDLSAQKVARSVVRAQNGMVASSQPLASLTGLEGLKRGGNAVDAAIAMAAVLNVTEPMMTGLGGDMFALVYWSRTKELKGLNASGRAPRALSLEHFAKKNVKEMPQFGMESVTVPGAFDGWVALNEKYGTMKLADLLAPAIAYAENGFPVMEKAAEDWEAEVGKLKQNPAAAANYLVNGRAPRAGEIFRQPNLARTLRTLATGGRDAFYHGEIAHAIADYCQKNGGFITLEDLAATKYEWVEPISTNYRGYDVYEIPPNGQGITALIALNILEGFDLARHPRDSAKSSHLQLEAMKLAFADAARYVADPQHAHVPVAGLLDKRYAAERRALIGDQALFPEPGTPPHGGTVYLCAADADGMMVSMIQSNYNGFGSGIVVPGTGIALQNRGRGFSLEPGHPNAIAPGKRPYHTIIPAFLTRGGQPIGPFGVMGGFMQPQGHVQMVVNQVDYGMNPQAALDAPRWRWVQGREVEIEAGVPDHVFHGLAARGHSVAVNPRPALFGRGQIIARLPNGAYVAGTEPRADGCAAAY